jgi:regulator of PEP synthase PpsR (kinase-PPPase family)
MTPPRPRPTPQYVTAEELDRRVSELKQILQIIDGHILNVEEITTTLGERMAANFDQLDADLNTLAAGYQSLQAANAILQAAVDAADADKAAAVAAAIAADDAVDQAAVDAADAIATAVLNPAPPAE